MKEDMQEMENSQLVDEVLPDVSPEGSQERKLARYAAAKSRQVLVSDHILQQNVDPVTGFSKNQGSHLMKVRESLDECGSFLVFRHYFTVGVYKLVTGSTCKKHLLCALCAIRRAAKCIAVYSEKISQVCQEQATEYDELMITFTVKNGDDLADRFDHLLGSMGKLLNKRRSAMMKKPLTDTQLKHLSGAVYSYEVTYSKAKGFHPHCHMIALVPPGTFEYTRQTIKGKSVLVPQVLKEGIVSDWKSITGDSWIIDVRKIESTDMPLPGADIKGTRLEALVEVFKYSLKMNDMDVERQVHCYSVLRGRRMIGSFGSLWGVKIPENLNDLPLTDAELPFVDLVYQYSGVNFGYQLTTHSDVQTCTTFPTEHHKKDVLKQVSTNYTGEKKWKKQVKDYLLSEVIS